MKDKGTLCPACSCILGYTPHSLWCMYERTYEQRHAPAPRNEGWDGDDATRYYRPERVFSAFDPREHVVSNEARVFELSLNDYDFGLLRDMHIAVDWNAR